MGVQSRPMNLPSVMEDGPRQNRNLVRRMWNGSRIEYLMRLLGPSLQSEVTNE